MERFWWSGPRGISKTASYGHHSAIAESKMKTVAMHSWPDEPSNACLGLTSYSGQFLALSSFVFLPYLLVAEEALLPLNE